MDAHSGLDGRALKTRWTRTQISMDAYSDFYGRALKNRWTRIQISMGAHSRIDGRALRSLWTRTQISMDAHAGLDAIVTFESSDKRRSIVELWVYQEVFECASIWTRTRTVSKLAELGQDVHVTTQIPSLNGRLFFDSPFS